MELRNDQDRVEGLPKCTLPEFIAGEALLITPSKFALLFFLNLWHLNVLL